MRNQPLSAEQRLAPALLQPSSHVCFFVSREIVNLLRFYMPLSINRQIVPLLGVLVPTKYQRRWARRLQQHFNFGREDAQMLSLATFGTDVSGNLLGVDLFVTFDRKCRSFPHKPPWNRETLFLYGFSSVSALWRSSPAGGGNTNRNT